MLQDRNDSAGIKPGSSALIPITFLLDADALWVLFTHPSTLDERVKNHERTEMRINKKCVAGPDNNPAWNRTRFFYQTA
jgi:hypothetical protein